MEFEELISRSIELIKSEPTIAIVIMVIGTLLLYFKTKPMLKILGILLVFALVLYSITLLSDFTSTGKHLKEKMIQQDGGLG